MRSYIKPAIFSLLAASMAITGCLKDKDYEDGKTQSLRSTQNQRIIEMSLTATSTDNFLTIALDNISRDTTFDLIPITLASKEPAAEDIHVILTPNPALIGDYNGLNGTSHGEAPSSLYTILNPQASGGAGYIVTIAKGTNVGYLKIKLKPSDLLALDYALGYQITKVEPAGYTVGINFSTGVVAIVIKNEWDGIYTMNGYALRAGDPGLTGNFRDAQMALVTSGASSVRFGTAALWGDGVSGISTTAVGYPNLAINTAVPAPYPITITSFGGFKNDPNYTSRYVPSEKTFYISMTWGAGPTARLATDTLIYRRPR